jgi:hypothetical protein
MSFKTSIAVALLSGTVGALAIGSSPALADVCLTVNGNVQAPVFGTPGDCTTSGEQMVFLNKATDVTSGTGQVGSQNGTPTVDFTSASLLDFANGFATIDPSATGQGVAFGNLNVTVGGLDFTDILFGLQMANLDATDLVVAAFNGAVLQGEWVLQGLPHDANEQFAVIASNGQAFTELDLSANAFSGIKQAKEFEISGLAAIPEPSSWAMMVLGFAGLGYVGYRKTKSQPAIAA